MKLDKFDYSVEVKRLAKRAGLDSYTPALTFATVNKPYTFVQVVGKPDKPPAIGFAKCRPGDTFDEDIGLRIATARALRNYAKVMNEQPA